jgi:hypothetical protein
MNLYVSPNAGNDANTGRDWTVPKRTVQNALNTVAGPCKVHLEDGGNIEPWAFTAEGQRILGAGAWGWGGASVVRARNDTETIVKCNDKFFCGMEDVQLTGFGPNWNGIALDLNRASFWQHDRVGIRNGDGWAQTLSSGSSTIKSGGTGVRVEWSESVDLGKTTITEFGRGLHVVTEASCSKAGSLKTISCLQDLAFEGVAGGWLFLEFKAVAGRYEFPHKVQLDGGGNNTFMSFDVNEGWMPNHVVINSPKNRFFGSSSAPQSIVEVNGAVNQFYGHTFWGGTLHSRGDRCYYTNCDFFFTDYFIHNPTTIVINESLSGGAKLIGSYRRPMYEQVNGGAPTPPPTPPATLPVTANLLANYDAKSL